MLHVKNPTAVPKKKGHHRSTNDLYVIQLRLP